MDKSQNSEQVNHPIGKAITPEDCANPDNNDLIPEEVFEAPKRVPSSPQGYKQMVEVRLKRLANQLLKRGLPYHDPDELWRQLSKLSKDERDPLIKKIDQFNRFQNLRNDLEGRSTRPIKKFDPEDPAWKDCELIPESEGGAKEEGDQRGGDK